MTTKIKTLLMLAALPLVINSCKKDSAEEPQPAAPAALEIKTVSNLFANDSAGHHTFFNLRTNAIVNLSDSATANWDIAFFGSTILINSGTSGPGSGAAAVVTNGFDDITSAPADSSFKTDNGTALAVPTGSDNGWYHYDAVNHLITPISGRTLVVKTADGKFSKIEILSYYKDAPANPTAADISRYYKFRFAFQSDGTKNLQ
jgi:hypothetical protein